MSDRAEMSVITMRHIRSYLQLVSFFSPKLATNQSIWTVINNLLFFTFTECITELEAETIEKKDDYTYKSGVLTTAASR